MKVVSIARHSKISASSVVNEDLLLSVVMCVREKKNESLNTYLHPSVILSH